MVGNNEFVEIKIEGLSETLSLIHYKNAEKIGNFFFTCIIILFQKQNDDIGPSSSVL